MTKRAEVAKRSTAVRQLTDWPRRPAEVRVLPSAPEKEVFMNKIEALQPQFKTGLRRSLQKIEASAWEKNDVGINVVLGISDLSLPARFLAGFAPAFSLGEALEAKRHVQPQLRVFVPLHLSHRANGIALEQGEQSVRQGFLFIQKFQEIFHPSISWFLDRDKPFTDESIALLLKLSQQLLSKDDLTLKNAWEKTFGAAQKRGNAQSALIYTPHHIFGWHDAWDPTKFFPALPKRITLNCFSQSEETFQPIRKALMLEVEEHSPELVVHGDHLDLITNRCPGPHYLPRTIGNVHEPLLGDLLNAGFEKIRKDLVSLVSGGFQTALKDLDSLNQHLEQLRSTNSSLPNIEEFIGEVKNASQS